MRVLKLNVNCNAKGGNGLEYLNVPVSPNLQINLQTYFISIYNYN